jgi:hypothetical protein
MWKKIFLICFLVLFSTVLSGLAEEPKVYNDYDLKGYGGGGNQQATDKNGEPSLEEQAEQICHNAVLNTSYTPHGNINCVVTDAKLNESSSWRNKEGVFYFSYSIKCESVDVSFSGLTMTCRIKLGDNKWIYQVRGL